LARRVLSAAALALSLIACKHKPPPAAAGSTAPANSAAEGARQERFLSELQRAQQVWREQPTLGQCAPIMKEAADQKLCADAEKAVTAVAAVPVNAKFEDALPVLGDGALALQRLLERARYLSLLELGRERLEGDAGAKSPLAPSASTGSAPHSPQLHQHDRKNLKLVEGPLGRLAQNASRLERDVLRQFGAYLEYGPLPARQAAFERAKRVQEQHPQWPSLRRLLREATVLESDPDLKARLSAAAEPVNENSAQPADSK